MGEGIKTLCGWCGVLILDGPLDEFGRASHGICPACRTKVLDDFAKQALDVQAGVDMADGTDHTAVTLHKPDGEIVDLSLYVDDVKIDPTLNESEGLMPMEPKKITVSFGHTLQQIADGIVKTFGELKIAGIAATEAFDAFAKGSEAANGVFKAPLYYGSPYVSPWMTGDVIDKNVMNDWTPEDAPPHVQPFPELGSNDYAFSQSCACHACVNARALKAGRVTPDPPAGGHQPARTTPAPFKPTPEPHTRKIELDEDE